jgi:hypothetical protein
MPARGSHEKASDEKASMATARIAMTPPRNIAAFLSVFIVDDANGPRDVSGEHKP